MRNGIKLLTALFILGLSACATSPDDEKDDGPDSRVCTEDWEVGSPRDPAKVCRQY